MDNQRGQAQDPNAAGLPDRSREIRPYEAIKHGRTALNAPLVGSLTMDYLLIGLRRAPKQNLRLVLTIDPDGFRFRGASTN